MSRLVFLAEKKKRKKIGVRRFSFYRIKSAIFLIAITDPIFRFSITFRSFIGIRLFKHLEFRLETLFLFNQLKQVFATVILDLSPD